MAYSALLTSDEDDQDIISSQESSFCLLYSATEDEGDLSRAKRRREMQSFTAPLCDMPMNGFESGACGRPDDLRLFSRSRTSTPIRMLVSRRTGSPILTKANTPDSQDDPFGTNDKTEAPRSSTSVYSERKNTTIEVELKKLNKKIHQIEETLTKYDERSKRMEQNINEVLRVLKERTEPTNTCRSKRQTKIEVPTQIAQAIRDGFQQGGQEKDLHWASKNGLGHQLKFNSVENREMTDHILLFVKGQYPSEQEGIILEGIKTNFESSKARKRREETGKQEEHNKKMAIRSRMARKTYNRKKALISKTSISEDKKNEIRNVLILQYCSSEESDSEDETSFIVRPLPWRSDDYTNLVHKLDQRHTERLSKRSKRQCNVRKTGTPSTREKPPIIKGHEWVFK